MKPAPYVCTSNELDVHTRTKFHGLTPVTIVHILYGLDDSIF
jgi:hypothetical protein